MTPENTELNRGERGERREDVEISGDKMGAFQEEVDRFFAVAAERFGIQSLVMLITWPDDAGQIGGGWAWRGNPLAAYGSARQFAIRQETLFRQAALEELEGGDEAQF